MSFLKTVFSKRDTVAIITLVLFLTKFLGFFKIRVIAGFFGAGRELDMFWAAFMIPDTIFNILIAGTINAAVIPVFSDIRNKRGEEKLLKLFSSTAAFVGAISFFVIILIFVFTPVVVDYLQNAGFFNTVLEEQADPVELELLVNLIRIMLLSPLLLSVSAIMTAFLQVHRRFFITATAPLLYNLGVIFGALLLIDRYDMGVEGLAWAVVLGSFLHFAIQIPILITFVREHLKIDDFGGLGGRAKFYLSENYRILKLAIPRMLAFVGEQINGIINTVIAFNLGVAGALSSYRYAFSLHLFPVQIFTGAIALITLPNLSEFFAQGNKKAFRDEYNHALRQTMFLILPSVAILIVLRLPIVRLVLGTGAFDWWDTVITSWSLALLGGAIIGQSGVAITLRAMFAIHETKLPLLVTFITILVNIAGSYFFTNFFSHYFDWRPIWEQIVYQLSTAMQGGGVTELAVTISSFGGDLGNWFTTRNASDAAIGGLALSLSVAFMLEMVLNMYFLNKKIKVLSWSKTYKPLLKMTFNTMIMMSAMYIVFRLSDFSLNTTKTINVLIVLIVTSVVGGVVYLGSSYLTGVSEIRILGKVFEYMRIKFSGIKAKING